MSGKIKVIHKKCGTEMKLLFEGGFKCPNCDETVLLGDELEERKKETSA